MKSDHSSRATPSTPVTSNRNKLLLEVLLTNRATWSYFPLVTALCILDKALLPLNRRRSPVSAWFSNWAREIRSNFQNLLLSETGEIDFEPFEIWVFREMW